jgi:hypothetical protein
MKIKFLLYVLAILTIGLNAYPGLTSKYTTYWIKGDVTVLAFIGEPDTLNLQMIRYTTYCDQQVTLLNRESGPGIYSFYLFGLIIKDENGNRKRINENGFFLYKVKDLKPESKKNGNF